MSIYKQTTVADFEKIIQELQGRFRGMLNTEANREEIRAWLLTALSQLDNTLYIVDEVQLPVRKFTFCFDSIEGDRIGITLDFELNEQQLFELNDIDSLLTCSIPAARMLAKQRVKGVDKITLTFKI